MGDSGSWVQDTAYSIVSYILKVLTGEWSNVAWSWFSSFFSSPLAVLDHPLVSQLVQIAVACALGLLPAVVAWKALHETLARMDGAATTRPETLVRQALLAGVAVTGTSLTSWFIGTLADLARDVLAAVGLNINLLKDFFLLPYGAPTTAILLILIFAIGAIILTIQRVVIAAEFTVLMCVGPLLAVGLMKEGGSSTWSIWLREVVSLMVTPVIQMLVLLLFIRYFTGSGPLGLADRLFSLGFLWVLWNTPRWARQMIYQVGAGGMMVNAAMEAGRMAVMRKMLAATAKG